ncbi:PadR family transcriptional regulator [Macrococcoides caseolyticum]|uniref:PadR family transcriptional regulator n=1 Tax=Macrococcoides caseolyticum TaxID=69966 RepID=UPI000C333746|nr:helix-turn-helix transcriptional regulator [Macrococcus caseolyticus]PKE05769.1 PadR family transcriptional regulator [Macrococcus caseolyticus]PKE22973.1 PadR family transcriptional regulator [Macrococcus caseolyticus]PKE51931.1 PadR family transcriptional regulator [Macrococcus caseolyticus]PKF37477.1 PadR family transcriptional regulator [Macrococcus caseolyticus]
MNNKVALTESIYYILLSLEEPLHGYGIIQKINRLSNDRIDMAAGTLYGALNTLIKKEWIELVSENGPKGKKEYQITDIGIEVLQQEILRLKELVTNGDLYLRGELY